MSFRLLFLIIVTAGGCLTSTYADNAGEQVRQSLKAMVDAPACKMVAIYSASGTKSVTVTLECIKPDEVDLRYEKGGRIVTEEISVGKKVYLRQEKDVKFKEFPGDASAVLSSMLSGSLQVFKGYSSVAFLGHQTVNGESTSVYRLIGDLAGAHSDTKFWISDRSHLPLKADAIATHPPEKPNGQPTQEHVATILTYGPMSKITPPSIKQIGL